MYGLSNLVRKVCGWGIVAALLLIGGNVRAAQPVAPYFNGVFPNTTPKTALGWTTQNAFPNLTFVDPMWLTGIPGKDELLLVGKSGKIVRFPNRPNVTAAEVVTVMDMISLLQISEDQGLYQLAFHPQFGQEGSPHANEVFVCYSHRPLAASTPDRSMWRVSRFIWSPQSGTIDLSSESVLIQQYDPHRWHNGGAMCFDNEGFLMITCGDAGGANDEYARSQRIDFGFFGGVLRIDVDNDPAKSLPISRQPTTAGFPAGFPETFSQGYGIPKTNPWVGGNVLEEFYAIGLRSPHSAHYDKVTGDLWVGDVGQEAVEELNRVTKGANLQWAYMEGGNAGRKTKPQTLIGTETPPFHSYAHGSGACIIGGPRYRGGRWQAELGGKILFADNMKSILSTVEMNAAGAASNVKQIYENFGGYLYTGITNICTDTAGEIYFLKLNGQSAPGGKILKLAPTGVSAEAPALLSATGLFSNTATLQPSPALVAYDVASPLWSDGAEKKRWIALPNDGIHDTAAEKITFSEKGNWSFPDGTVFVKHFEMPVDERNPAIVRRLETRVMVCIPGGGKYGLTYKWNAAGTDATLLASGADEVFEVTLQNGAKEPRVWSYPSRTDCMRCHTDVSGRSIGLRTHQINRAVTDPVTGGLINQMALFNNRRWFGTILDAWQMANFLEARAPDDTTAPLEHRVRSYLDANCAHCHQPGSVAPYFDARLQTPLLLQNLVNGIIEGQFNLGPNGRYISPGNPSLSAVHVRAASVVPGVAMPPLGRHLVDEKAMDLLRSYVSGLHAPEFEVEPPKMGRFVRLTATSSQSGGSLISVGELSILDGKGNAIPKSDLSIESFTSQDAIATASKAIDGDPNTYWLTGPGGGFPRQLTVDLGSVRDIGGFVYTPRQDSSTGWIRNHEVHLSENGTDWTLMTAGSWSSSNASIRFYETADKRPLRCEIAGPATTATAQFKVTIVFDSAVSDFTAEDITVNNGKVTNLTGGGYYYVATVLGYDPMVSVSVAENVVNSSLLGNRASNPLLIQNNGEGRPVPRFSEVPGQADGLFEVILSFDKEIKELYDGHFHITHGTLVGRSQIGAGVYRLLINPSGAETVVVRLLDGSVVGKNNIPMAQGVTATIPYGIPKLMVEAESGAVTGGFTNVRDEAASGGGYLWVPDGHREGNATLDASLKASFTVNVPHSGDYQVKGWVRSGDGGAGSFYLGFDGEVAAARWLTKANPGGSDAGKFIPELANEDGSPRVFFLAEGEHRLELYAGDDGMCIDRVELVSMRPLPAWVESDVLPGKNIEVFLEFSSDVTGLGMEDFNDDYGRLVSVDGSGRRYKVTVQRDYYNYDSPIYLSLKEGAVQNAQGFTNFKSSWVRLPWVNTYEQWAVKHGVDPSPVSDFMDGDGDGLGQLMEYALGLDPSKPDRQIFDPADAVPKGLPLVTYVANEGGGHALHVSFLRRWDGSQPLRYTLEYTSDFKSYDQDESSYAVKLNDQWHLMYSTDPGGTGMEEKRFVRLKVERE